MTDTGSHSDRAWQRMLSGRKLDLLSPDPADVELEDIAHGLARVARWNGQTIGDHIFSVAQHSLLVLDCFLDTAPGADRQTQALVLLHDAAEYVIGDLISPFKRAVGPGYKDTEHRLQAAIHRRFGLPVQPADELLRAIKLADLQAAFLEATQLAGFSRAEALELFRRPAREPQLVILPADSARQAFTDRFHQLI